MTQSSDTALARSRKIEATLRNAINDCGRKKSCEILKLSEGHFSKFMAGNKDDAKINVDSISKLIESLGLKLVDSNAKVAPKGYVVIPIGVAVGAWHNSMLGMDLLKKQLEKEGAIFEEDQL